MGKLRNITSISFVIILMTTNLSAQGLENFLGPWIGIETLNSPTNSYENRNIAINISEGGERVGYLIYNSSSEFMYNDDLEWAYHYFGLDKNTNELIFLRRFITPIGIIGNQELRYTILEWDLDYFLAEYQSNDGDTYHQIRMNLNVLNVDDFQPATFSLQQNYPNPFNPSTTISFFVPTILDVKITAYNVVGNEVSTLLNKTLPAGMESIIWNAQDQPSGVYFIRMQSGDFIKTQKVMLLK